MTAITQGGWRQRLIAILLVAALTPVAAAGASNKSKNHSDQLRTAYIARLQQQDIHAVSGQTVGSLWTPGNTLGDLSTDYKARKLNDTIIILVAVQTTAAQSGNSNYQRTVQTSSAITGLA